MVVKDCDSVLKTDPKNIKGLTRRGQARVELKEFEGAIADFTAAAAVAPDNKDVHELLENAKAERKAFQQREASKYSKMFG